MTSAMLKGSPPPPAATCAPNCAAAACRPCGIATPPGPSTLIPPNCTGPWPPKGPTGGTAPSGWGPMPAFAIAARICASISSRMSAPRSFFRPAVPPWGNCAR